MTREDMPVFYELTGHDETWRYPGIFLDVLTKANIELKSLDLLQNDAVPADCATLIINGPQSDL